MIAPATSIPLTGSGVSAHNRHRVRWTPVYGRLDKVEFRGWEAPYPEQVDGREASSILGGVQAEGGPGGRQGRSDDGPTGEPGIRTSQMTAWKKQLMAQVAELFADRQRRRANQAADERCFYEQIGRLKMEVGKSCRGRLRSSGVGAITQSRFRRGRKKACPAVNCSP